MKKPTIWRLLVMGFISGVVGWLVRCSRALIVFPIDHTITFRQWFLFVTIPGVIGSGIGMLFPLWQKYIKIRHLLLQSIIFWLVVPTLLSILYTLIVFGFLVLFKTEYSLQLGFFVIGELVAAICFYLSGKLLHFEKVSKTHRQSEVAAKKAA